MFRLENRRGHSEAILAVNLEFTLNLELKSIEIIAKMFVALMFHENNASNRFFLTKTVAKRLLDIFSKHDFGFEDS